MSTAPPQKKYLVYTFGWRLVKKKIAAAMASSAEHISAFELPKEYLHVGVAVYNNIYHFYQSGIVISPQMPMAGEKNVLKPTPECSYSLTVKTKLELDQWVNSEAQKQKFGAGTYNLKDNTCITFARDLCDFLGVPFQGPQVELQDFLEKHSPMLERIRRIPVLTSLIGLVFLLGSRSSQNVSENVKDKVETLFQVKELMHTQFKLTNSGGIIYDETEGSVPFETSV